MKKVIFLVFAICLATSTFAQKGKLNAAKTAFGNNDLATAYNAITAASKHDKTKNNPETWVYKAQILSMIQITPGISDLLGISVSDNELVEALDKAVELDTDGKFSEQIASAAEIVINNTHNQGVGAFNDAKDFALASQLFQQKISFREKFLPNAEASAIDYVIIGASEMELGNTDTAISYYEKVMDLGYDDQGVYNTVILHYQGEDDEKYLAALARAKEIYPDNNNYSLMEIDYYISNGRVDEILDDMLAAHEKEPDNVNLIVTIASVYKSKEDFATEREWLQKGIAADPENFNAVFNLGVSYFNDAVKYNDEMNFMTTTTSPEYAAAKEKRDIEAEKAFPLFEKAYELMPDDQSVLRAMFQYYLLKNNKEKMAEFQSKLDALN